MDRQLKWDLRFLQVAELVASWSKDPSTKVGAVIVNPHTNDIISVGFNGFPRGVEDTLERYQNRELKYQLIVHAEENAIITAGNRALGGTIYVWPSFGLSTICIRCCISAIQAGILRVVSLSTDKIKENWKASLELSRQVCNEAGISYRGVSVEDFNRETE
jgi:dCMP deaminase